MGLFGASRSSPSSQPLPSSSTSASRTSQPARQQALGGTRGGKPRTLADLRPDTLYLMLYTRGMGEASSFHWGLYLHQDERVGGNKFHIRNAGLLPGNWMTDHGITTGALKSMALIGLIRVANYDAQDRQNISSVIRQDDERLNSIPGVTCRVWTLRACDRLRSAGYMDFVSLEALEREAMDFGNAHMMTADNAFQPRPLVDSQICRI